MLRRLHSMLCACYDYICRMSLRCVFQLMLAALVVNYMVNLSLVIYIKVNRPVSIFVNKNQQQQQQQQQQLVVRRIAVVSHLPSPADEQPSDPNQSLPADLVAFMCQNDCHKQNVTIDHIYLTSSPSSSSPLADNNNSTQLNILSAESAAREISQRNYAAILVTYTPAYVYPASWELADLARHLTAPLSRSPRLYASLTHSIVEKQPRVETIAALRQLARHSHAVIAATRADLKYLHHAYGIDSSKIVISNSTVAGGQEQGGDTNTTDEKDHKDVGLDLAAIVDEWPQVPDDRGAIYAIYVDQHVQLNGKVSDTSGQVETLAVRVTHGDFVVFDALKGLDHARFSYRPRLYLQQQQQQQQQQIHIDYDNQKLVVDTLNIRFEIVRSRTSGALGFTLLRLSRFAACSFGLLCRRVQSLPLVARDDGDDEMSAVDTDYERKWRIADKNDYFGHTSPGQTWSSSSSSSPSASETLRVANVFSHDDDHDSDVDDEWATLASIGDGQQQPKTTTKVVEFSVEGPFYAEYGFYRINRQMFLELYAHYPIHAIRNATANKTTFRRVNIIAAPSVPFDEKERNAEILMAYSLILRQQLRRQQQESLAHKTSMDDFLSSLIISFRNSYPPVLMPPRTFNTRIVLQTPWEYVAYPISWVKFSLLMNVETWTPTNFNRNGLIVSGMLPEHVKLVPHGINFDRYQLFGTNNNANTSEAAKDFVPYPLPSKKRFKFFSNVGLVARKGIDVLLDAYMSSFSAADDVTLIIHIHYDFHMKKDVIGEARNRSGPNAPELVILREQLSETDMIRLYKSVDVYVTPYRAEGFGLTIMEAMACGLAVIVTRYGPSLDFCSEETSFFVDANVTDCHVYPCGLKKFFQFKLPFQPRWAEPDPRSLAKRMLEAYHNPQLLRHKAQLGRLVARNYSWPIIGAIMMRRINDMADQHKDMRRLRGAPFLF